MSINPTSITPPTKPKPKPKKRRRRKRADAPTCSTCGDQLTVRWRGRWWCICCDERELFSDQSRSQP